eukprot:ANDGO_08456.mRNA.1 Serine protease/ABC transporter B family protein tagC
MTVDPRSLVSELTTVDMRSRWFLFVLSNDACHSSLQLDKCRRLVPDPIWVPDCAFLHDVDGAKDGSPFRLSQRRRVVAQFEKNTDCFATIVPYRESLKWTLAAWNMEPDGDVVVRFNRTYGVQMTKSRLLRSPTLLLDAIYIDVHRTAFDTFNLYASSRLQGSIPTFPDHKTAFPLWEAGLSGQNMIAAVVDTGLDHDHCAFRDPSVPPGSVTASVAGNMISGHRKLAYFCRSAQAISTGGDATGHGTHVAATVLGSPPDAASFFNASHNYGIAPAAKLAMYALADSYGTLSFTETISSVLSKLKSSGASVVSNSWGSTLVHSYDAIAMEVDTWAFSNPDVLIVFAAGNSGAAGAGTVSSPATSKNVIAVGSTDSSFSYVSCDPGPFGLFSTSYGGYASVSGQSVLETSASAGCSASASANYDFASSADLSFVNSIVVVYDGSCDVSMKAYFAFRLGAVGLVLISSTGFTSGSASNMYSQLLPSSFGVVRVSGAVGSTLASVANANAFMVLYSSTVLYSGSSVFMTAGSSVTQSSFSSQGISNAARLRPDLLAPGNRILSANSDGSLSSNNCGAKLDQGTSMATPAVSGLSLLVKQYLLEGFYPSGQRSSADAWSSVCAPLIRAVLVASASTHSSTVASYAVGYGIPELSSVLKLSGSAPRSLFLLQNVSFPTTPLGLLWEQCIVLDDPWSFLPLRLTLAYHDSASGVPSSGYSALNNKLRLAVIAPDGMSRDPGLDSAVNNVQVVHISSPSSGVYRVQIHSVQSVDPSVPLGLVVHGAPFRSVGCPALGSIPNLTCVSLNHCSAHGTCDSTKGICACDAGYIDQRCSTAVPAFNLSALVASAAVSFHRDYEHHRRSRVFTTDHVSLQAALSAPWKVKVVSLPSLSAPPYSYTFSLSGMPAGVPSILVSALDMRSSQPSVQSVLGISAQTGVPPSISNVQVASSNMGLLSAVPPASISVRSSVYANPQVVEISSLSPTATYFITVCSVASSIHTTAIDIFVSSPTSAPPSSGGSDGTSSMELPCDGWCLYLLISGCALVIIVFLVIVVRCCCGSSTEDHSSAEPSKKRVVRNARPVHTRVEEMLPMEARASPPQEPSTLSDAHTHAHALLRPAGHPFVSKERISGSQILQQHASTLVVQPWDAPDDFLPVLPAPDRLTPTLRTPPRAKPVRAVQAW